MYPVVKPLNTATYYKAGGLPWRLARDARQPRTSFVGLSFYQSIDGDQVRTSTAQMFDEKLSECQNSRCAYRSGSSSPCLASALSIWKYYLRDNHLQ
jgi:hypothetical protein